VARRFRLTQRTYHALPLTRIYMRPDQIAESAKKARGTWAKVLRDFRRREGPEEAMRRKKNIELMLKNMSKKQMQGRAPPQKPTTLALPFGLKSTHHPPRLRPVGEKTAGLRHAIVGAFKGVQSQHKTMRGWRLKARVMAEKAARAEDLSRRAGRRTWKLHTYPGAAIKGFLDGLKRP